MIHLIYIYFIINTAIAFDWSGGGRRDFKILIGLVLFGLPFYASLIFWYLSIDLFKWACDKTGLWVIPFYYGFRWKKKFRGILHGIGIFRKETNPITKYYIKKIIMWHYRNRNK